MAFGMCESRDCTATAERNQLHCADCLKEKTRAAYVVPVACPPAHEVLDVEAVLLKDSGWHGCQPGTFKLGGDDPVFPAGFSFVEERGASGLRFAGRADAILAVKYAGQT